MPYIVLCISNLGPKPSLLRVVLIVRGGDGFHTHGIKLRTMWKAWDQGYVLVCMSVQVTVTWLKFLMRCPEK